MRYQGGSMGLWDRMDKRYRAYIPDLGQVGCPIGSQGTMGLWDEIVKRNQACILDLGLMGYTM